MKKFLKILGYLFLFLVLFITSVVIFFAYVFDWNSLSGYASRKATDSSGRQIVTTGIGVDWGWPVTTITLKEVNIANTEGSEEPKMLELPSGEIGVDVSQLIRFKIAFSDIILDQPKLVLEKDKEGKGNWDFSNNAKGAAATDAVTPEKDSDIPQIGRILIRDGNLRYRDEVKKTDLQMAISNFSGKAKEAESLVLHGKGSYGGFPMKLEVTGGNLDQLRENKVPYPVDAEFVAGKTSIAAKGTIEDIVNFEGVNLNLTIKGDNAADLFPLTGIVLPPTPPYDITGKLGYSKADQRYDFTGFKGKLGDSDLSGDVHWDTSKERPKLSGNFVSEKLDMDDLAGFVGAPPSTKPGETASEAQKAAAAALDKDPFVIPDVPLDISRVAAMDADVTFQGKEIANKGVPLDNFLMHITLDNKLLEIKPVKFGSAQGDITAHIKVNARKEPVDITMDTTFHKLPLARFFAGMSETLGTENVTKGNIGGLARLQGQGKSMREFLGSSNGTVGLGMQGGQLSHIIVEAMGLDVTEAVGFFLSGDKPTPVRCVIADFGVKNGKMKSNAIVLDTNDTNIEGEGMLDFKTEKMDFTLRPHPKDKSILTLRSPLHVRGTLKSPSPSIDKTSLIARAAAGVALALATPVAALLATIEPGQGEDSPCVALLGELKQDIGDNKRQSQGKAALIPKNATPEPVTGDPKP